MTIEKYSILGSSAGGNLFDFTNLFDALCEWDSRVENDDGGVTYVYCGATLTLTKSSGVKIAISNGEYSNNITVSSSSEIYINILIVKTESSIGVMLKTGKQNANITPNSSGGIRFVITKCMNLDMDKEEKGIVIQISTSISDSNKTCVLSENSTNSDGAVTHYNPNSSATVLYPATDLSYPGYCPHVFIPVFQDCGYVNHKVTVNGSDYYILGGTLYLLDD